MTATGPDELDMHALYEAYLDACNAHDFDRMSTFYTPDIHVNDAPMEPTAVSAQFAPIVAAFPDWHWDVRHIAIAGDLISLHFTVGGTHRGEFAGIAATGRRVSVMEFTLYRVKDGKFDAVWDLVDWDAVRRQITDAG